MSTLSVILLILAIVLVAAIILFLVDRDRFWERFASPIDMGDTDFESLKPARKPNEGLVCPENLCAKRKPDLVPPVYNASVEELRNHLISKLKSRERTDRVDDNSDKTRLRYVTRSRTMRFPDTMSVQFIDLGKGQSTVAVHARARLGHSDAGANLARIKRWLAWFAPYENNESSK